MSIWCRIGWSSLHREKANVKLRNKCMKKSLFASERRNCTEKRNGLVERRRNNIYVKREIFCVSIISCFLFVFTEIGTHLTRCFVCLSSMLHYVNNCYLCWHRDREDRLDGSMSQHLGYQFLFRIVCKMDDAKREKPSFILSKEFLSCVLKVRPDQVALLCFFSN